MLHLEPEPQSKNNSAFSFSKSIFDTLLQAYRHYWLAIVLVIVLGFVGRFLILSNAQIIGQFIDQHPDLTLSDFANLVGRLFLLLSVAFALTLIFRAVFSRLSAYAVSKIYDETTYRVSRFPISFFESQPVGKITTRFSSDYGNIFRLFGGPLAEFLSIIFDLVSIVIIITLIHPLFLINLLVASLLYLVILKRNQLRLRQSKRDLSSHRAPSISHFSETAQGAITIRQNQKTNTFTEKFSEYDKRYLTTKKIVFLSVMKFSFELNILSALLFAANGFLGLYLIRQNILGIGLITVILSFTILATHVLQMFFEWFSQFEEGLVGVEKLDEYLRAPLEANIKLPAYAEFETFHPKHDVKEKTALDSSDLLENTNSGLSPYHLDVSHLNFQYPTSDGLVLKDISFQIKKGEKLGIIGRTGSGKSTIISCLLQLYPIKSGGILINNHSLDDVEKHRSLFSVISQDQLFLEGSVRENLDLFYQHSEEEIQSILKQVGLGLDLNFRLSEKAQNISFGEKQLLSLARGMLQKAEIFIFDEATSNVDPQSEMMMNRALSETLKNMTQIRIAHRLQTVEDCHQILWLDQGRIKRIGPAQEVLVAFKQSR